MDLAYAPVIAGLYFIIALSGVYWFSRRRENRIDDFFLSDRNLPWYAIALSLAGSNIGAEYFIGIVSVACLFGLNPIAFEWGKFLPFSCLAWIVLPYFYRKKLYTVPEFLEHRFSATIRIVMAGFILIYLTSAVLTPALYVGGRILHETVLQHPAEFLDGGFAGCIFLISTAAAFCSLYGGFRSVVVMDILLVLLLLAGAILLAAFGMKDSSVWQPTLDTQTPLNEHSSNAILPGAFNSFSWSGILIYGLMLSIWQVSVNPLYLHRCVSAKSEWDAKMGTFGGALLKVVLAALSIVPLLSVFSRIHSEPVNGMLSLGSMNLILNPLGRCIVPIVSIAALLSTASSVLVVSSAIWTLDVHKRWLQPDATEEKLVAIGRSFTFILLVISTALSPFLLWWEEGISLYIQNATVLFAPPLSVIFFTAFFWRKAHTRSAILTFVSGLIAGFVLMIPGSCIPIPAFQPQNQLLNRTIAAGLFCLFVQVTTAYLVPRHPNETTDGDAIWKSSWAHLPAAEQYKNRSFRNLLFAWTIIAGIMAVTYIVLT